MDENCGMLMPTSEALLGLLTESVRRTETDVSALVPPQGLSQARFRWCLDELAVIVSPVVPSVSPTKTDGCASDASAATGPNVAHPVRAGETNGCPEGMARIPGGSLKLDASGLLIVKGFCLDRSPVTVDAYSACIRDGRCSDQGLQCDGFPNYGAVDRGNHPINCVAWLQASMYCTAHGLRLPTEEEWAWASHGGEEGRRYPWGNAPRKCQLCSSDVAKRTGTCPVGSFPEGDNRWGVHDLAGNVAEWMEGDFRGKSVSLAQRGSSWGSTGAEAQPFFNGKWGLLLHDDKVGFRCATDLPHAHSK
jgi:formylglycine-generating enzyme required for sulfatase activity